MTKKLFDRLKIAAVALSLAGAAVGCSQEGSDGSAIGAGEVGSIGFNLTLPSGTVVDPIKYTITGPTAKSGTIPTMGNGTTFSVNIDGLKAGTGYTITLDGVQNNGAKNCFGSAMFEVKAKTSTSVQVKLSCPGTHKGDTGSVMVNGQINICAVIDSAVGTPSSDGTTVALTASASDEDMGPSAPTYKWTAPSGTFASATSANTTYSCAVDGMVTLVLEVSDSDCGDKLEVPVTCKAGSGGTGGAGAGGAGAGGAGTGGAGTGGAGAGGAGAGGAGAGGAGTGGAGAGGAGAGGAGTGGAGTGGAGAGGAGAGGAGAGGTGTGGGMCEACEMANATCNTRLSNCTMAVGNTADGTPKAALCQQVVDCVRKSKCTTGGNGMTAYNGVDCYCGIGADFDMCASGAVPASGACKDLIAKGAESTNVSDIGARFTDPGYATGLAFQLLQCDSRICNMGQCDF